MINYKKAIGKERLMRAVIGMGKEEFSELLKKFLPQVNRTRYKRNRKRKAGAGRTHTLETAEQKLFYILFYMKCYPTFDMASFFFQVDRSQTKRWVDQLRKPLEKALGYAMALPVRKVRGLEEFLERFPEVKELIIDGTERAVQRPKNKKKQKQRYSGKKKRHTQKNIVMTTAEKEILYLSPTGNGKEHDYAMLKKSKLPESIPFWIKAYFDLGFNGVQKDYSLNVYMPIRKPKTRELYAIEKESNKEISRFRVKGENAIAGIKRLRCITDVCRMKTEELKDNLMYLSCGLWNFHLQVA